MTDATVPRRSFADTLARYLRPRPLGAFLLGITSGFPLVLLLSTMSFWLSKVGIDKKTIGFAFALGTPYTLKFLWAPLIDGIAIPCLARLVGQRRAWLYVVGALLAVQLGVCGAACFVAAAIGGDVEAPAGEPVWSALAVTAVLASAGALQAAAFTGAMLALLAALVSPLDGLGEEYLFSAHMVQHVLLGDIAPLLLLLSLPLFLSSLLADLPCLFKPLWREFEE